MKTSTVSETHSYGSANLTGYTYRDQVCLTANSASCVQNFEYFAVFDQFGLRPPIEGILGLSQNKQFIFSDTPRENGPLFIQELQKAGKIKSQTFSFNQRGYYGDPSTFDIGDPVIAKM